MLSLLYGPTLTSVHDYWKNHSFDFVSKVIALLFNTLFSTVQIENKYLLNELISDLLHILD